MKRMNPMETVSIRSAQSFRELYNQNLQLIDEVLDKLIVASNRQNARLFLTSTGCLGLTAIVYVLVNKVAKLEEQIDILSKANKEES